MHRLENHFEGKVIGKSTDDEAEGRENHDWVLKARDSP